MPWQIDGKSEDNRLMQRDIGTSRLKNVHYVEGGSRDGLPVVLLHDNLASSRWWEAAQEQLAYRYHSFALDLRGYGATEYQPANSLEDFALDLDDFVTTLSLPKFFLVGWGMGGGIGMQYAIEHPANLAALCLVNSISPRGHRTRENEEQLNQLSRAVQSDHTSEVATYLRRNYFRGGNFPVGDLTEGGETGDGPNAQTTGFDYIMAGSMQSRNFNRDEQGNIFKALRSFDVHKAVGSIPGPVFAIFGDSDHLIKTAEMEDIRGAFSNVDYDETTIPFCGHSPMVEQAEAFSSTLNGYVGRLNFQHVVHPSTVEAAQKMEAKDTLDEQPGFGTNATSDIAYQNRDSQ